MLYAHRKINIAPGSGDAAASLLSYYDVSPKVNMEDSREFYMYAGLYFDLITAGDNQRFLKATTKQDLRAKKYFDFRNVIGLEDRLSRILAYNIRNHPFARQFLTQGKIEVVWETPFKDKLSNHEARWLRVVRSTLNRLYSEYN